MIDTKSLICPFEFYYVDDNLEISSCHRAVLCTEKVLVSVVGASVYTLNVGRCFLSKEESMDFIATQASSRATQYSQMAARAWTSSADIRRKHAKQKSRASEASVGSQDADKPATE